MAALRSLLKKNSSSIPTCNELVMIRRLFSSEAAAAASPSFAQRLRDLPKDLPGTKIKTQVSQVCPSPSISLIINFNQKKFLCLIPGALMTIVFCFAIYHFLQVQRYSFPGVFIYDFNVFLLNPAIYIYIYIYIYYLIYNSVQ
jgi:hypothetical protein